MMHNSLRKSDNQAPRAGISLRALFVWFNVYIVLLWVRCESRGVRAVPGGKTINADFPLLQRASIEIWHTHERSLRLQSLTQIIVSERTDKTHFVLFQHDIGEAEREPHIHDKRLVTGRDGRLRGH